jgi:acyl carrier protein
MTELTPRQREILSKLREMEELTGNPAIVGADSDAVVMELDLYGDIGLDSLEVVELGMEIEEAFGVELGDAGGGRSARLPTWWR